MIKFCFFGKPNVGKSSLFNRLIEKNLALVDPTPGLTRDYKEHDFKFDNHDFILYDIPGLELGSKDDLNLHKPIGQALNLVDTVVWVLDATDGDILATDREIYLWLRKHLGKKKLMVVVNKCEKNPNFNTYALGIENFILVSAHQNIGMVELLYGLIEVSHQGSKNNLLEEDLGKDLDEDADKGTSISYDKQEKCKVTLIGRPNVGKSSLVNSLIGFDRCLTGPMAGLTRDSIRVDLPNSNLVLFDTAGQRKKICNNSSIENKAVALSNRTLNFSHGVVLVLDAREAFEKQDLILAKKTLEEGRFLVIALNKWDTIKVGLSIKGYSITNTEEYYNYLKIKTQEFVGTNVELVRISATEKTGIQNLITHINLAFEHWNMRFSTSEINRWLQMAISKHPPKTRERGIRPKIKYATQVKTRPAQIAIFVTKRLAILDDYMRYLENSFINHFKVSSVPIRFVLCQQDNPFKKD